MSDAILTVLIGGLLGLIGGAIGSILAYKNQKPLTQAQYERSALQDSNELRAQMKQEREEYRTEYRALKNEFETIKEELESMRGELDDLRLGVGILTAQLIKNRITPEWKPRGDSGVFQSVKPEGLSK